VSEVFHKPVYQPYFLLSTNMHAKHIKKNISLGALVRAIGYFSSYDSFKREEANMYISLLLNKYPMEFILQQFETVPRTYQCTLLRKENYLNVRKIFLDSANNNAKKS